MKARGIDPKDTDPLIMSLASGGRITPITTWSIILRVERLLERAQIRGRRFGENKGARYEHHAQSFRKFGRIQMQNAGAPPEAIEHLMGHTTSTYSKWLDRKDELLEIYRRCMPRLEQKDTVSEVLDFARSRGFSLDPKSLLRVGDIRADQGHSGGREAVGA